MLVRNLCFLLRTIVMLVRNLFDGITYHFKHLMFYFIFCVIYFLILLLPYYSERSFIMFSLQSTISFINVFNRDKINLYFWPYINFFSRETYIIFWHLVKIDHLFTTFFFVREIITYLYILRSYPCKKITFCILDCSHVSHT